MAEFPPDHPGAVAAANIAAVFMNLLDKSGGLNYVEAQFDDTEHPENPSIAVLVQKVGAMTPAEKAKHLLDNLRVVKSQLLALRTSIQHGGRVEADIVSELARIINLIEDQ